MSRTKPSLQGLVLRARLALTFGLSPDYDLDGWQDLLTANGHLEEEIRSRKVSNTKQSAHMYWNAIGFGCRFLEVSSEDAGGDLFSHWSRVSAFADL